MLTRLESEFVTAYCAAPADIGAAFVRASKIAQSKFSNQPSENESAGLKLMSSDQVLTAIENYFRNNLESPAHEIFDQAAALRRFLDIATADPTEAMTVRVGCCRHCYGIAGQYQWSDADYALELEIAISAGKPPPRAPGGTGFQKTRPPHPNCTTCGGEGEPRTVLRDLTKLRPGLRAAIRKIKPTKDGIEIEWYDKMKALEQAARIIGAFDDRLTVNGDSAAAVLNILAAQTARDASNAYAKLVGG